MVKINKKIVKRAACLVNLDDFEDIELAIEEIEKSNSPISIQYFTSILFSYIDSLQVATKNGVYFMDDNQKYAVLYCTLYLSRLDDLEVERILKYYVDRSDENRDLLVYRILKNVC
ncbi:MAG: hypothetical protein ACXQS8_06410 [Candidatus Helarchaeales archaeon]